MPPAPTPIEPGGMLVPHHLNAPPPPPHLGERIYPLSRILVAIGNYQRIPPFRAFSGNFPDTEAKNTPFPEEMGTLMRPLMNSRGGEGGGGGVAEDDILLGRDLSYIYRLRSQLDFCVTEITKFYVTRNVYL